MIDILVFLFENYYDLSSQPKPDTLARKLSVVGFEQPEISLALGWLSGVKNAPVVEFSGQRNSSRIYSPEEQQKLGAECLSFVCFLEDANVITPALRELIIDRGMLLEDFPVPLAKFKIVVLMVLWSQEKDLDALIVEELLYSDESELLH